MEISTLSKVQDTLENFANQLKKKDNLIQLIFVPEPIVDDLKSQHISMLDLLYYDKATASLSSHAINEFVALNSFSKLSPIDHSALKDFVLMSEKLTPLMGEALDIRQFWLAQVSDDKKEDMYNQFFSKEKGEYTIEDERFRMSQVLNKVVNGICSQTTFVNRMYESIEVSPSGQYYFITVPYSSVECEQSEHALGFFSKKVMEAVLRKSSIYHPEKIISSTSLFGNYLLSIPQ